MKIGYPCINRSLKCRGNKTFRLKSYSQPRFIETVKNNLNCLQKILRYNLDHDILFFRISSDIIPFASHPICTVNWATYFEDTLEKIGIFIKKNDIRISMHPDQFIVLNSKKPEVVQRSIRELEYHAAFLEALNLDTTAKIQLHVGGVYENRTKSMNRFVNQYALLPKQVKSRLVIENDDRSYSVKDCYEIYKQIQIPILLDVFHHQLHNDNESFQNALKKTSSTWDLKDGIPMIDYSTQLKNDKKGKHTNHIDINDFVTFLTNSIPTDFDVMLEIKDKEKSAIEAVATAKNDSRFFTIF